MFKNVRIKFILASAFLAMILSLVSAGLGGVPLGAMILRCLLGGVFMGALALGLNLAVDRFLPELLGSSSTDEEPVIEPAAGGRVDIVMPEENPVSVGVEETDSAVIGEPGSEGENPAPADEPSFQPAGLEQVAGGVEPVDGPLGKLEDLPDIDRFSDSFEPMTENGAVSGLSDPAAEPLPKTKDIPEVDEKGDPAEMARAVQTIMKRED